MAAPKPFVDPLAGKNPTARQPGGGVNPSAHGQSSGLSTVGKALLSAWHAADNFMQQNSMWLGIAEVGLGLLSMTPVGWLAATAFVLGTAMSVATTVDSCVDRQWGGCAIGVASLGATYGGFKMGKVARDLSKRAKMALSGVKSSFYSGMSTIAGGGAQVFNGVSVGLSSIGTAAGDRLNHQQDSANP